MPYPSPVKATSITFENVKDGQFSQYNKGMKIRKAIKRVKL